MKISEIVESLIALIKPRFGGLSGIILIGSSLRYDSISDADIDLVIVFDRPVNRELKDQVYDLINDYMIEKDIFLDCKIYKYNQLKLKNTPFRENVMTTGKFYAA